MYPSAELSDLAERRALLRARIAHQRLAAVGYTATLAKPIEMVDGLVARWRALPIPAKLALVPLSYFTKRIITRKIGLFRSLLRLAPITFGAARMVAGLRR
jgi:hypothetical protein